MKKSQGIVGPHTRGLLRRMEINGGLQHCIGKEVSRFEEGKNDFIESVDDMCIHYDGGRVAANESLMAEIEKRGLRDTTKQTRLDRKTIRAIQRGKKVKISTLAKVVTRRRAQGTALSLGQRPNELWCTDYKGEFLLGNHQYCYPLTVTNHASRFLLTSEALCSTREDYAFTVFERLFKKRGLPANIRSDNGVPFASAHALFNLSKLAVWWLRLGIGIERIKPGSPQQNGRHERMHLTLKKEATKPAARNFLQQQARFDKFIEVFNNERPHEALGMQCPADVYQASPRPYQGLPDIDYPFHDRTIVVTHCGRICLGKKKINFSTVFAGQAVGIKEVHDDIWLVSFMDYDLGYFDLETLVLEPLENPFGPKVLPMSPGRTRNSMIA